MRFFQDGSIEPLLAPEVIVHRCSVGPRPAANLLARGFCETLFGKHLTGCLQQLVPRRQTVLAGRQARRVLLFLMPPHLLLEIAFQLEWRKVLGSHTPN